MSLEHDIWFNLAEKAAFMPDGVKFCGIICNAEVWLVKDKAAEEFLRRPSAKPAQVNPVPFASKQARAELRDRFAGYALMGMMASRDPSSPRFHPETDAAYVYAVADAMLKARDK